MEMISVVIGLAVIAGGWVFHLRTRGKVNRSATWPSVPGVIDRSEVVERTEQDSDGGLEQVYYAEVAYSYAVAGQSLSGRRVTFGGADSFNTRKRALAIVERYPAGTQVPVRYNPDKPSEAVLESSKPSLTSPIAVTVVGLVIVVAGLTAG